MTGLGKLLVMAGCRVRKVCRAVVPEVETQQKIGSRLNPLIIKTVILK